MKYFWLNFFLASSMIYLLGSCCPKDPSLVGNAPRCPNTFWEASQKVSCPCDFDIENDPELKESEQSIQRPDVAIVDLIDVALLNNPTTKVTWANARAAAYNVGAVESTLYPNVVGIESLNFNWTEFDGGLPLTATGAALAGAAGALADDTLDQAAIDDAQANANGVTPIVSTGFTPGHQINLISDLSISYLLLDFGGRRASIEAAKQALYSSNWIHNRQVQQVLINVLQAYYNYAGVIALLEARYEDLKNSQANFAAANAQFEAGVKNKLDVLQARTNLINIELAIVNLKGQKEVAYGRLANALGFTADAQFSVPKFSEEIGTDVIQEGVDDLIKLAWERRPDLAAAYAQHNQAKEEVIIARSAGMPRLSTFIDLEEFNNFRNPSFNNHSISGSLVVTAPIFSGFFYINRERQAREIVRASCSNLRNVEINISLDVITSYFNFKTAVKSLKLALENLKNSEEAYKAAYVTYREGISTILDLLLAQTSLSESKAQVITARTAWAIALSNISFSVGTLGTHEEIKPWEIKK